MVIMIIKHSKSMISTLELEGGTLGNERYNDLKMASKHMLVTQRGKKHRTYKSR